MKPLPLVLIVCACLSIEAVVFAARKEWEGFGVAVVLAIIVFALGILLAKEQAAADGRGRIR